ncbi:MAG: hypothetical protein IKG46_06195 [Solobacterium sp.]|nr:hypothetical protein [Solobacterium sp.]
MLTVLRLVLAALFGVFAGWLIRQWMHRRGRWMDDVTEANLMTIGAVVSLFFYSVVPFVFTILEAVIRSLPDEGMPELEQCFTYSIPFRLIVMCIGTAAVLIREAYTGYKNYETKRRNAGRRAAALREQQRKENAQRNELDQAMRYLNDPAWMKQLDESILASIPPRTFTTPGYSLRFYPDGVYTEGRVIVQKDGQEQSESFRRLCMKYPFPVTWNETLLAAARGYGDYVRQTGRYYEKFEIWDRVTDSGEKRCVYYNVRP